MATYIKTLKEDNGDIVYPQTITDAIYTSGGQTLETEISKYVTAEDIASSVAAFGTVTGGMIDTNTITSSNLNLASVIDLFYPVGSYYETSDTSFDPNVSWTGTWVEDSAGKVLVSKDTGTFATVGDTGGVEKTNHVFYRQALNSGNFQDAGQSWLNDILNRANTWLQQSGSSSLTLDTTVKALGGTIGTNTGSNTEVGFFKYTSTTLQPYVVIKRWHRTA